MSRHSVFLDEIIAHPEEDLPRLVYADWLDEQGDPRGEFIRIQCLLAKLPFDDDRRWALQTRETLLKRQYGKGWANPIRHLVKDWQFHRGFVEGITIRAVDFLEHAATLFQSAPICRVRLLEPESQLSAIAASPWLDRITGLDLSHTNFDWNDFADLAYSPSIIQLRELNVRDTSLCNNQGSRMLAECEFFRNLTALNLSQYRAASPHSTGIQYFADSIGPSGIQAMSDSPHLKNLTMLNVAGYGEPGSSIIGALADSSLLGQITSLDLSHNGSYLLRSGQSPDVALDVLFQSPQIANLQHLVLIRNHTANSVRAFAESSHLGKLQSLYVGGTWLDSHGQRDSSYLGTIAESPNLNNLVSLNLSGCTINDNAYRDLFASDQFHKLKELNLSETQISNESLEELADSSLMENLRSLRLQGSDGGYERSSISENGLRALVEEKTSRHLEILDLGNQEVGDDLEILANSELAGQLCDLGLWKTGFSEEVVPLLCDAEKFPKLELLDLRESALSDESKEQLRDTFDAGVRYGPGPQVRPNLV